MDINLTNPNQENSDAESVLKFITESYLSSSEQKQSLVNFVNYLALKNLSMNLIGKSTIEQIWHRHILDSAQVFGLLKDKNEPVADLGSGAGFPGLVLSILGLKEVHLIEKSSKKADFLREAKKFSANKVLVHNRKIEDLSDLKFNILVSRALAPLDKLLIFASQLIKNDKKSFCLFLKGKNFKKEIIDAQQKFKFEYELFPSLTSQESFIVKVFNITCR
jgi:16S rRNA (guanine527-N7)-methyltransferase